MFFNAKMNEYCNQNNYEILKQIILLFIGCLVGIIYIGFAGEDIQYALIDFFDGYNTSIIEKEYVVDSFDIIFTIVKSNAILFLCIIVLGSTIIFMPFLNCILLFKGFTLGITVSVIILTLGSIKGIIYTIISLILPNLIIIFCTIYVITLWKNVKRLLKRGNMMEYKKSIYKVIIKSLIILLVLIIILIPIQIVLNQFLLSYIKII